MADFSDWTTAAQAVADPAADGDVFAQVPQAQRALWPLIAAFVVALAVAVVATGCSAGMGFGKSQPTAPAIQPDSPFATPIPPLMPSPTPVELTPPDGNSTDLSQAAWISVPGPVKAGALRVDIHFDYQCPYCKMLEDSYAKGFESLANSGDIVLNLHARTFLDGAFPGQASTRAAVAAACVDYADDTKFYAYNNTIFANQPATEGGGYTDQQLTVTFPSDVGLTGAALDKFNTCYSGRQMQSWVTNAEANNVNPVMNLQAPQPAFLYGSDSKIYVDPSDPNQQAYYDDPSKGNQVGVTGTPTIFVNGKPLTLNQLFTVAEASSDPTPSIGTDPASVLALLQQIAGS